MFSSVSLLVAVTLALSVAANPIVTVRDSPITLSVAKRFNFTNAARIIDHDQARAKGLKALGINRANRRLGRRADDVVASVPAVNEVVNYAVNVSIIIDHVR